MAGPLPIGERWPEDNLLAPQHESSASFHAYVHIPFCTVRCGYCDFNTYTQQEIAGVSMDEFHKTLVSEIAFSQKVLDASNLKQQKLKSVFFGGGTPSLFAAAQIDYILRALEDAYDFQSDIEITIEANPESTSTALLEELKKIGVNRVSLGVQSFDEQTLKVLDRQHNPALVAPLVREANRLGLTTSVDLIYGAPYESLDSWKKTVEVAVGLGSSHVSAYSLIVEEGTKLARLIKRGDLPDVDEDLNAEKYEFASSNFEESGFEWYEVSNFGSVSEHNLSYWQSQNWWGYGPGAHSHLAGNRFWNHKHPSRYAQDLITGSPAAGIERLSLRQRQEEALMLGLRTKFGVERQLLNDLGVAAEKVANQIAQGLLTLSGSRVVATKAGRLLVDRLVVDFLQ